MVTGAGGGGNEGNFDGYWRKDTTNNLKLQTKKKIQAIEGKLEN